MVAHAGDGPDGKPGIRQDVLDESHLHIQVPAGTIPRDGPRAGVAMFLSVASLSRAVPAEFS
jgi:ATP-dependent Lon protease